MSGWDLNWAPALELLLSGTTAVLKGWNLVKSEGEGKGMLVNIGDVFDRG